MRISAIQATDYASIHNYNNTNQSEKIKATTELEQTNIQKQKIKSAEKIKKSNEGVLQKQESDPITHRDELLTVRMQKSMMNKIVHFLDYHDALVKKWTVLMRI